MVSGRWFRGLVSSLGGFVAGGLVSSLGGFVAGGLVSSLGGSYSVVRGRCLVVFVAGGSWPVVSWVS